MANEFSRNRQESAFIDSTFPLSATTGTATRSDIFDLGAFTVSPENVELEVTVPALPTGVAVEAARVEIGYELSTSPTFGTTARTIVDRISASTVGTTAQTLRYRLPSNSSRYVRATVNVNTNATTGGASAATYNGGFSLKF